MKKTLFLGVSSLLVACGSGGAGEPPSVNDSDGTTLKASFEAKVASEYRGLAQDANMTFESFQQLMRWAREWPVPRVSIASSVFSFLENTENHNRELNQELPCDELARPGSMKVTGSLDSSGLGRLDVEYLNCRKEGFVFNGFGELEVLEQKNGTVIHYRNYYENVTATYDPLEGQRGNANDEFTLVTFLGYREQYGGGIVNPQDSNAELRVTYHLLISDQDSSLQVVDRSSRYAKEHFSTTQTSGRIAHSQYGVATIEALDYYFDGDEFFTLFGYEGMSASWQDAGDRTYSFLLDQNADGAYELGASFISLDEFYQQDPENMILTAVD